MKDAKFEECEGGVALSLEPCPRCGATRNNLCGEITGKNYWKDRGEQTSDTKESVAEELAYFEAHADRFADAHRGIASKCDCYPWPDGCPYCGQCPAPTVSNDGKGAA